MYKEYLTIDIVEDKILNGDYNFNKYDTPYNSVEIDAFLSDCIAEAIKDNNKEQIKKLISTGLLKQKYLSGIDLKGKDLSGTGLGKYINSQLIMNKDLCEVNLSGEDLRSWTEDMLDDVNIEGANLTVTGIGKSINPQRLYKKSLKNVNLENEDLSHLQNDNFAGTQLEAANLSYTKTPISLLLFKGKDLSSVNLIGCHVTGCPGVLCKYNDRIFDDEYKNKYPQYFLSDNAPDILKNAYYDRNYYALSDDDSEEKTEPILKFKSYLYDKFIPWDDKKFRIINSLGWEIYKEIIAIDDFWLSKNISESLTNDAWENGFRSEKIKKFFMQNKSAILNKEFDFNILKVMNKVLIICHDTEIPKHLTIDKLIIVYSIFNNEDLFMKIIMKAIELNHRLDENLFRNCLLEYDKSYAKFGDPVLEYARKDGDSKSLLWYRHKNTIPDKSLLYCVPEEMIKDFDYKGFMRIVQGTSWEHSGTFIRTLFQMYVTLGPELTRRLISELPEYISEETYNDIPEYAKDAAKNYFVEEIIKSDFSDRKRYRLSYDYKASAKQQIDCFRKMLPDERITLITGFYEHSVEVKNFIKSHLSNLLDPQKESSKEYLLGIRSLEQIEKKRIENLIRGLLNSTQAKEILYPDAAHKMFDGVDLRYDEEFGRFFERNYKKILGVVDKYSLVSKVQKSFQSLKAEFKTSSFSLDQARRFFADVSYNNILPGNNVFAEKVKNCGYSQREFEELQKIYEKCKNREKSSIPQIQGISGGYTYGILDLDDPLHLLVGHLTGCCYDLYKEAESSMIHGASSPNGRVFVIEKDNKVVAQSWVWRNGDVLCFDNIEVAPWAILKDNYGLLDIYKTAAKELVKADNASMKDFADRGVISDEQYQSHRLKKVTVGIGFSDIRDEIKENLQRDTEEVKPFEANDKKGHLYIGDSQQGQYILYIDEEFKNTSHKAKTAVIPLYQIENTFFNECGDDISNRTADMVRTLENSVYPHHLSLFNFCKDVGDIADVLNYNKERMIFAGNRDWYIIFELGNNGIIHIGDLARRRFEDLDESDKSVINAKVNKVRSEMYEYLLRAFQGKAVRCNMRTPEAKKLIRKLIDNSIIKDIRNFGIYSYRDDHDKEFDIEFKVSKSSHQSRENVLMVI